MSAGVVAMAEPIRPVEEMPLDGGTQQIYRFDNNYGASVIRAPGSYGYNTGLWELSVTRWSGDDWELSHETPITNDVVGWLSNDEVQSYLRQIRALADPDAPIRVQAEVGTLRMEIES